MTNLKIAGANAVVAGSTGMALDADGVTFWLKSTLAIVTIVYFIAMIWLTVKKGKQLDRTGNTRPSIPTQKPQPPKDL